MAQQRVKKISQGIVGRRPPGREKKPNMREHFFLTEALAVYFCLEEATEHVLLWMLPSLPDHRPHVVAELAGRFRVEAKDAQSPADEFVFPFGGNTQDARNHSERKVGDKSIHQIQFA